MGLIELHKLWAVVCVGYCALISAYGLWRLARSGTVDRLLLGMLAVGEGVFVIQGAIGLGLAVQGLVPGKGWVHGLYGSILLLTIPVAYYFSRGRSGRREATLYTIIGLFLAGIAVRAMMTGAP